MRVSKSDIIDMTVIVTRATERAVLVQGATRDTGEPQWFPLSQVELSNNGDGTLTLAAPEWLLIEKGFL